MSSHRVIYLISQWHPGNEWCLQEMNTAQPIATGKPQEKILEIMYFSAQLPSGKESRERALLTLQVMELRRHRAYLGGRSWDGPCRCNSSVVLSEAEASKAKREASKIGRRHPEPACVWLSVLDSLLFTAPQHHQFSWLLRSHPPLPLCPSLLQQVKWKEANGLGFPAQLLGNLEKRLHFIGFKKHPSLPGYIFIL